MEWQPIETAPRDGSWILLFFPEIDVAIGGCYASGSDYDFGGNEFEYFTWFTDCDFVIVDPSTSNPTHWMPLPPPPPQQEVK